MSQKHDRAERTWACGLNRPCAHNRIGSALTRILDLGQVQREYHTLLLCVFQHLSNEQHVHVNSALQGFLSRALRIVERDQELPQHTSSPG